VHFLLTRIDRALSSTGEFTVKFTLEPCFGKLKARTPVSSVWTFFAAELANIKPGVEAWIAAQRLNSLAQVL
jgi:hypothetical protein